MSFWTDLENFVKSKASEVKATLIAIGKSVTPVIEASAEEVGTAALSAVLAQVPLVISGQEKLKAATNSVVSQVTANGKSVLASTAETAVQTAFNIISSEVNK